MIFKEKHFWKALNTPLYNMVRYGFSHNAPYLKSSELNQETSK
jgi:hypothetical protein